jgi:hypothetical protein
MTIPPTQPRRVYISTASEGFVSMTRGDSCQPLGIKNKWPLPCAGGMAVKTDDPSVLFAGCGETATGEKGHVLHATDLGEDLVLPLICPRTPGHH